MKYSYIIFIGLFTLFSCKSPKSKATTNTTKLNPESKWIVTINNDTVSTIDFQKLRNSIKISEIEDVTIFTNDTGPIGIDVWWRLSGNGKLVFIPGGATGETEMLHRLQKLEDFNNKQVIKAMGSVDNAEFLIWKRK